MTTPNLLDIKQLAAYLNLSVGATYRRHQRGQLPGCIRLGRSLRWRQEEIDAMLTAQWAPAVASIVKTHIEYARAQIIAGRATPTPTTENEEMTK